MQVILRGSDCLDQTRLCGHMQAVKQEWCNA
jgi:hypothetical protein